MTATNTNPEQKKEDPIREKYFKPIETAELWNNVLFFAAAVLSFAVLLVSKDAQPRVFAVTQIVFILSVIAVFALGLVLRLYLIPSGEDQRRLDLLSNATKIPMTHESTVGYYNNDETDPIRRLGVSTLENTFFTKAVCLEMLRPQRILMVLYVAVLIVCWLRRSTDFEIAAVVAQIVFSEQLLARWFRLEWLRVRSARVYKALYDLFQTTRKGQTGGKLHAHALQQFSYYEATKAIAGITLSSRIFERLNPNLSREWDKVRAQLDL